MEKPARSAMRLVVKPASPSLARIRVAASNSVSTVRSARVCDGVLRSGFSTESRGGAMRALYRLRATRIGTEPAAARAASRPWKRKSE